MCVHNFIKLSAAVHELYCANKEKTPMKAMRSVATARTVIIMNKLPASNRLQSSVQHKPRHNNHSHNRKCCSALSTAVRPTVHYSV